MLFVFLLLLLPLPVLSRILLFWGILLFFRWNLLLLLKEKEKGFYFLIVQEGATLIVIVSLLLGWREGAVLSLLLKIGLPPLHRWVKNLFYRIRNTAFLSFLSIYKIPPLWILLLLGRGFLFYPLLLLRVIIIIRIKEIQLLLLFSSGVLIYFSLLLRGDFSSCLFFLSFYLLFFWDLIEGKTNRDSFLVYLLFVIRIPPVFHFFFKVFLLRGRRRGGPLVLVVLLSFSLIVWAYYSFFNRRWLKGIDFFPFLKGRRLILISALSLLLLF